MDFMNTIAPMMDKMTDGLSAGRMIESVILLAIIWQKLKPHLEKIEHRLAGLESAVKAGFDSGEQRFQKIEDRITVLESKENV